VARGSWFVAQMDGLWTSDEAGEMRPDEMGRRSSSPRSAGYGRAPETGEVTLANESQSPESCRTPALVWRRWRRGHAVSEVASCRTLEAGT